MASRTSGRVLLGGALVTLMCVPVLGGPQGERVVRGSAKFKRDGARTVIRAADNTIINYRSFDIGAGEIVRFIQPGPDARVLNRIRSVEPTRIDGVLRANGQVYLVNRAGVIFGPDSIVNVGALHAAAGGMSNRDFLAGIDRFELTGDLTNLGEIRGDRVVLAGQRVHNLGTIIANEGFVAMVAGDEVLVGERDGRMFAKVDSARIAALEYAAGEAGVTNAGAILARDGQVIVGAGDFYGIMAHTSTNIVARDVLVEAGEGATTRIGGTIDASGRRNGNARGGSVRILGDKVALEGATIDASGSRGGGEILVGGEYQGRPGVRSARRTFVDGDSTLRADALREGDGGRVIVWSDELTGFAGELTARGGVRGGDGGFAEISGKHGLIFRGEVDVLAANGTHGTILFDPDNITIIDGGGGADDGELGDNQILGGDGGAVDFVISEQALEALSGSVILQANDNITVNDLSDNELSFAAVGGDTVEITADFDGDGVGTFSMFNGDNLTTAGGDLTISGATIGLTNSTVDTNGGNLTLNASTGVFVRDILTGGGAFVVDGDTDGNALGGFNSLAAGIISTNGGNITISAGGANFSLTTINTGGGDFTISVRSGVESGLVNTAGGNYAATADDDGDNLGVIRVNGAIASSGGDVMLSGNDWEINDTIDAGAGDLSFDLSVNKSVTIGVAGGAVDIDATELGLLTTSGTFRVGTQQLGSAVPTSLVIEDLDLGGTGTITGGASFGSTGTTTFSTSASSIGGVLAIDSGDLDVQVAIDASDFSFDRAAGGSVGVGDATGDATISNAELALITASTLSIGGSAVDTITLDNVNLTTFSGQTTLNAGGAGGQVIFQNVASTVPAGLSVQAASGITIGAGVTSNGTTTFDVTSGVIDVTGSVTVDSQGGLLNFLDAVTIDTGVSAVFTGTGVQLDSTLAGDTGAESVSFDAGTSALTVSGGISNLDDLTIVDAGATTLATVSLGGTFSTTNALGGAFGSGNISAGTIDLDGTTFTFADLTSTVGGITITNSGQADFGGDVSSAGAFTQDGAGAVLFSGGAAQSAAASGSVSIASGVTIATGTNLTLGGDGVTLASTLAGQSGTENVALDSGTGLLQVDGAVSNLDNLTIDDAGGATFGGTVTIGGAFSSTNALTGALDMGGNALSAGSVDLDGTAFVFDQVTTTGGGFTLTNTGGATFNADVSTAGDFVQDGSGTVGLDGDITSNDNAISINGATTVLGDGGGQRVLDAGTGALTLGAFDSGTFATLLRARTMTFGGGADSVTGSGALSIEAAENDDPINIGFTDGGEAEALNLTTTTLNAIDGSFDVVIFGDSTGTNAIDIQNVSGANAFGNPMLLNAGGGLRVLSDLTIIVTDPQLRQTTLRVNGDTTIASSLQITTSDETTSDTDPASDSQVRFDGGVAIGSNELTVATRQLIFAGGDASVTGTGELIIISSEDGDPMNLGDAVDFGEDNAFNMDLDSLRAIDGTFSRVVFGFGPGALSGLSGSQIDVQGINASADAGDVFDNPVLFNAFGGLTLLDDLTIDTSGNPNAVSTDLDVDGDTTIGSDLTISVGDGQMQFQGLVDLDGNDLTLQGSLIDPLGGAGSVDDFGAGVNVSTLTLVPGSTSADIDIGLVPVGEEGSGLRFGRGDLQALGTNFALIQFGFDGGTHTVRIGQANDLGGIDSRLLAATRISGDSILLYDEISGANDASFTFDGDLVIPEGVTVAKISTADVDEFGLNPGAGNIVIGGSTGGTAGGVGELLTIHAARDVQFQGAVSGDGAGNADSTGLDELFFEGADDVTFSDGVDLSGRLASDGASRMTGLFLTSANGTNVGSVDLTGTAFIFEQTQTTSGDFMVDNSSSLAIVGDLSIDGSFIQMDALGTGTVVLSADIDTTFGSGDGDATFASPTTLGGDGPRLLTLGTGQLNIEDRFDISFGTANPDPRVIVTANGYNFTGDTAMGQVVTSSGDQAAEIIFRPATAADSIDIGPDLDPPAGTMVFGFGDLQRLDGTFSLVRFGYETTGSHDIRIGTVVGDRAFKSDTIFHAPGGTIEIVGPVHAAGSLTFDTATSSVLGDDIITDGGDVIFGDGITLTGDVIIDTQDNAGDDETPGEITIGGAIDGDGNGPWSLTLHAFESDSADPGIAGTSANILISGDIGTVNPLNDLTMRGGDIAMEGIGVAPTGSDGAGVLGMTILTAQDDLILRGGVYTTRSAIYAAGDEIRPVTDAVFEVLNSGSVSTLSFVGVSDGVLGGGDDDYRGIRLENGSAFTARTRGGDITIERGFARVGDGFADVELDADFGSALSDMSGSVSVGDRIGFNGQVVSLADDTVLVTAGPVDSVTIRGRDITVNGAWTINEQSFTAFADGQINASGDFEGLAKGMSPITFDGTVVLTGDTTVTTGGDDGDDALFSGTIDGAFALSVDARAESSMVTGDGGDVTVGGLIGGDDPLASLSIEGFDVELNAIGSSDAFGVSGNAAVTAYGDMTLNGGIYNAGGLDFESDNDILVESVDGIASFFSNGGDLLFGTASGAMVPNIRIDPASSLFIDSRADRTDATSAGGDALVAGNITTTLGTGDSPVVLVDINAGTGRALVAGVGGSGVSEDRAIESLVISADEIDIGGSIVVDTVTFQQSTPDLTINVGGDADVTGELDLLNEELDNIQNGTTLITIGSETGTGIINFNKTTFFDPLLARVADDGPGGFRVLDTINGNDDASIEFAGDGTTTELFADIITEQNRIEIDNHVIVSADDITLGTGGGDPEEGAIILIRGTVNSSADGPFSLTLDAMPEDAGSDAGNTRINGRIGGDNPLSMLTMRGHDNALFGRIGRTTSQGLTGQLVMEARDNNIFNAGFYNAGGFDLSTTEGGDGDPHTRVVSNDTTFVVGDGGFRVSGSDLRIRDGLDMTIRSASEVRIEDGIRVDLGDGSDADVTATDILIDADGQNVFLQGNVGDLSGSPALRPGTLTINADTLEIGDALRLLIAGLPTVDDALVINADISGNAGDKGLIIEVGNTLDGDAARAGHVVINGSIGADGDPIGGFDIDLATNITVSGDVFASRVDIERASDAVFEGLVRLDGLFGFLGGSVSLNSGLEANRGGGVTDGDNAVEITAPTVTILDHLTTGEGGNVQILVSGIGADTGLTFAGPDAMTPFVFDLGGDFLQQGNGTVRIGATELDTRRNLTSLAGQVELTFGDTFRFLTEDFILEPLGTIDSGDGLSHDLTLRLVGRHQSADADINGVIGGRGNLASFRVESVRDHSLMLDGRIETVGSMDFDADITIDGAGEMLAGENVVFRQNLDVQADLVVDAGGASTFMSPVNIDAALDVIGRGTAFDEGRNGSLDVVFMDAITSDGGTGELNVRLDGSPGDAIEFNNRTQEDQLLRIDGLPVLRLAEGATGLAALRLNVVPDDNGNLTDANGVPLETRARDGLFMLDRLPVAATIVIGLENAADVAMPETITFDVGQFVMGFHEVLTANANLMINADTISIGDVNVLGTLSLGPRDGGPNTTLNLLHRPAGPGVVFAGPDGDRIVPLTNEDGDLVVAGFVADAGLPESFKDDTFDSGATLLFLGELAAVNEVDLAGAETEFYRVSLRNGRDSLGGNESARTVFDDTLQVVKPLDPVTKRDFFLGEGVAAEINGIEGGADLQIQSARVFAAVAAAAESLVDVPDTTPASTLGEDNLKSIDIVLRDLEGEALINALIGRAVYEDLPLDPVAGISPVTADRLSFRQINAIRGQVGVVLPSDNPRYIKDMLEDAALAFSDQSGIIPDENPRAFADFVFNGEHGDLVGALGEVARLRSMLRNELVGLTPGELARAENAILRQFSGEVFGPGTVELLIDRAEAGGDVPVHEPGEQIEGDGGDADS